MNIIDEPRTVEYARARQTKARRRTMMVCFVAVIAFSLALLALN